MTALIRLRTCLKQCITRMSDNSVDGLKQTNVGMLNAYVCPNLHVMVTYDYHKGTTPYMIKCRTCGEKAISYMYRVNQNNPNILTQAIWYTPCKEECDSLTHALAEHVTNGGLILKVLEGDKFKPLSKTDLIGYKQWAVDNYTPHTKISYGIWHPLVCIECENINERTPIK